MAHRSLDNGKDEKLGTSRPGVGTEPVRQADASPPGSRERGESDVSGWNPARDESPSVREGRFYRAASLRMAQPRTDVEDRGGAEWAHGGVRGGPYGRDDRDDRYATGIGPRAMMGEHDQELAPQPAEYRSWDRTGYGGDEGRARREPRSREEIHGARRAEREDDRSWREEQARREPGDFEDRSRGEVSSGREFTFEARPRRASSSDDRVRTDSRVRDERTRVADHMREDRSQDFRMGPIAAVERLRWQREPLTARDVMTRNTRTARRDSSLRDVARLMKEDDCGVIPIVNEHGRLEGTVTDRDLAIQAFSGGQPPEQLRASDVMTDDIHAVTPDENLHTLVDLMAHEQIRRIPVVERDDRFIGIVTLSDIAQRADGDEELQRALARISSRRSFWSRLR
ncbi:CBS domain-containing protein [Corallococcus terminator]